MPEIEVIVTHTIYTQGDPDHLLEFQFGFEIMEFLEGTDGSTGISIVVVQIQETPDSEITTLVEGTDYTVDLETRLVIFESGDEPDDGTTIKISRFTRRARVNNYSEGSPITHALLDTDNNQEMSILQEIESDLDNALKKTLDGSKWNAEGLEGSNAAPATQANSWVTLAQLVSSLHGGLPLEISEIEVFAFTGDGETTEFELNGWNGLEPEQVLVTIENVIQRSDESTRQYEIISESESSYPVGFNGFDVIRFDEAPADDSYIEVRVISGTVVGRLNDDSVETAMIQDGAITLDKLNLAGAGDAARFLRIRASGEHVIEQLQVGMIQQFHETVVAKRLDQFAVPTANLNLNNRKITNLGSATASTDAATLGQVTSAVNALIRTGKGEVTLPAAVGLSVTIDVGFNVERFALSANVGTGFHYTWDCVFPGALPTTSKEREVAVPGVGTFKFKKLGSGTQIQVTWHQNSGIVALSEAGWYAIGP